MTLMECTSNMFVLLNAARIVAYIPQLVRVHRDCDGAKAVSVATWTLFAAGNLTATSYALIIAHDALATTLFALSTLVCAVIVALTLWKRSRYERIQAQISQAARYISPPGVPASSSLSFSISGDTLLPPAGQDNSSKLRSFEPKSFVRALAVVVTLIAILYFVPA